MPDTATATGIDEALYRAWVNAKVEAGRWAATLKEVEAAIEDQTGAAKVVTVDGTPVMRLIIREAKNVTWVSKYYRRLGDREGDDA